MKGIGIGPAGGLSMSRTLGTKVTLAGRTAFLPNDDVPFVMQKLTMGQINAIPKDRFSVALIEVPTRMGMAWRKTQIWLFHGSKELQIMGICMPTII